MKRFLAIGAWSIVTTACAPSSHGVTMSRLALPGRPAFTFANTLDRVGTTAFSSNPTTEVAGINGQVLTITAFSYDRPQDKLAIDLAGDVGIHGSYHSLSSRAFKKDVATYGGDAVEVLDRTRIVTFRYDDEPDTVAPHVGLLAEEAPPVLTDPARRSLDLNNALAITMAASQQLSARLNQLQRRVSELERKQCALREDFAHTATIDAAGEARKAKRQPSSERRGNSDGHAPR